MTRVATEALLAAGYAAFLLCAALGLDLLAGHTHRRSLRFRTAGFTYHEHLDAWICPEGEHLWPSEHDRERRLVRYRARPQVCNACPAKARCTDSDEGREVVRFLDPWIRTEAGRFHRTLALTLVALASLVAAIGLARNHAGLEVLLLGGLLALAAVLAQRLVPRNPAGGQAGGS